MWSKMAEQCCQLVTFPWLGLGGICSLLWCQTQVPANRSIFDKKLNFPSIRFISRVRLFSVSRKSFDSFCSFHPFTFFLHLVPFTLCYFGTFHLCCRWSWVSTFGFHDFLVIDSIVETTEGWFLYIKFSTLCNLRWTIHQNLTLNTHLHAIIRPHCNL